MRCSVSAVMISQFFFFFLLVFYVKMLFKPLVYMLFDMQLNKYKM